jgi:hypothetical protein
MTEAAAATSEPTGGSVKAATEYQVFELRPAPETEPGTTSPVRGWFRVGVVSARSAEAAVRQYAEKSGSTTALTLAAVASRYWVTATLRPSTVTTWEPAE